MGKNEAMIAQVSQTPARLRGKTCARQGDSLSGEYRLTQCILRWLELKGIYGPKNELRGRKVQ